MVDPGYWIQKRAGKRPWLDFTTQVLCSVPVDVSRTTAQIAEVVGSYPAPVGKALDRLATRGFVVRGRLGRQVVWRLSRDGRRAVSSLRQEVQGFLDETG